MSIIWTPKYWHRHWFLLLFLVLHKTLCMFQVVLSVLYCFIGPHSRHILCIYTCVSLCDCSLVLWHTVKSVGWRSIRVDCIDWLIVVVHIWKCTCKIGLLTVHCFHAISIIGNLLHLVWEYSVQIVNAEGYRWKMRRHTKTVDGGKGTIQKAIWVYLHYAMRLTSNSDNK